MTTPITVAPSSNTRTAPAAYGGAADGVPGSHHGRLDFVDGIRAIAALFVVLCHSFFEPAAGFYPERFMNHLGLSYGHVAVDMFIVVSGFCLMLPIARRDMQIGSVPRFFGQRCRRILPPYYAALALTVAYIAFFAHQATGTVWDTNLPMTRSGLIAHLLLVHDLPLGQTGGMILYPVWSIAVEFQVYFFMPVIVLAMRRFGDAIAAASAVLFGIALHLVSRGALDSATPWYVGLFVFGCIAARRSLAAKPDAAKRWMTSAVAIALPTSILMLAAGKRWNDNHFWYVDTAIGAATAFLLASLTASAGAQSPGSRALRGLSWKPLVWVGVFSYSLYLVHAPVLHALDRAYTQLFHPTSIEMFALLLASSPIVIAFAYLFHICFEKPFMRKAAARPSSIANSA
jgi:peptidoglycan/LPS O-acetylase OafA/YrhL